jgi:hypothetical protein
MLLHALALLAALAPQAGRQNQTALVGAWTATQPSGRAATLRFLSDGRLEVEFQGDAATDVAGRYRVAGNELTITDEAGLAACLAPQYAPGRYRFDIFTDELTLDVIKDDCEGRVTILDRRTSVRIWTRKS